MPTSEPAITSFSGINHFLSNFFMYRFVYDGIEYRSSEHAFQAQKPNTMRQRALVADSPMPGVAKKIARSSMQRADWAAVKNDVMLGVLRAKFAVHDLRLRLLATGNAQLVEGNTWGDRYWGQSPVGDGENILGKLLMQVREEYRG